MLDLALSLPCVVLPWLMSGWAGPALGLALLVLWVVVVRPTWRGLAPFYLTLALLLNLLARVGVWVVRLCSG